MALAFRRSESCPTATPGPPARAVISALLTYPSSDATEAITSGRRELIFIRHGLIFFMVIVLLFVGRTE
jgi:hypothetical protein